MPHSNLVLVDASIWIKFFRAPASSEAEALDVLLSAGAVATCAPIRAEVVSGAQTKREFDSLRDLFGGLVDLELPQDLWPHVEEHRFALARRGYQIPIVDLMIALTAQAHQAAVWTLDQDFTHMATTIPIAAFRP